MLMFFVLTLLLLLIVLVRTHRKLPYPPGPRGLPVIGNMLMADQLSHRGLAELAKIYGGLFHLRLGLLHMVVVSTPEFAREVLQVQDKIFSNRPATRAVKFLTYDRADMAFAQYGPFWRQMRKLCFINLFSPKRAESWAAVQDEVECTVRSVATKYGSPVNICELAHNLTSNITYRAAFGSDLIEGQVQFVSILQELSMLLGVFSIGDFFPGLNWVDPRGLNTKLSKVRQSLYRFIDRIIDDHLTKEKKTNEADNTDLVDDLLAFYSEEAKNTKSVNLIRENIKAVIMDVMFGGTTTVALAIEWTMTELMKNPEDLMRVQRELSEVVGQDRRVQESDLDELTYLKCVIKETLRLHPPIPLLLHETSEDAEVVGYYIPARTRVVINSWAIGRDKTAWDDPEAFNPSRFLNKGAAGFKGNNFEFIPFGSGRRSCPGMNLGHYAVQLAVAHLLHCFSWELPNGMKPSDLDVNDLFGLSAPRESRLVAVPSPRPHSRLF